VYHGGRPVRGGHCMFRGGGRLATRGRRWSTLVVDAVSVGRRSTGR